MERVRAQGVFHLFLIFMFSMVFMWIGITYVSQNIRYSGAHDFFDTVVYKLEEQNFSAEAKAWCMEKAEENGYSLEIQIFGENWRRDARVILAFSYTFPIIHKVQRYTIEGYAR